MLRGDVLYSGHDPPRLGSRKSYGDRYATIVGKAKGDSEISFFYLEY